MYKQVKPGLISTDNQRYEHYVYNIRITYPLLNAPYLLQFSVI